MKKNILLVFFIVIILVSFQNCIIKFNEFGDDSVFYYLNDEPVVPVCSQGLRYNSLNVSLVNDTLRVHICGKTQIDYMLSRFRGKGLYRINSTSGNTCSAKVNYTSFNAIDDGKTFFRILEIDTLKNHLSAVFEADLVDNSGHHLRITKGRMDVKFLYTDY